MLLGGILLALAWAALQGEITLLNLVVGYIVGIAYGEQSIVWMQARYPRTGRLVRLLERWFVRAAPLLLFAWPGPLFCALAGAGGMRAWLFVSACRSSSA